MKWSDALNEARENAAELKRVAQQVNDYWDSRGLAGDAKEQIGKHLPDALQGPANEVIDRIDRMLNALTDPTVEDSDTVPDAPLPASNG